MSISRQSENEGQIHEELSTASKKPDFRLPKGYKIGWKVKGELEKQVTGGYVLRDPKGQELGYFEPSNGKSTAEDVLRAHLAPKVIGETRETLSAVIDLRDSEGKIVGSWIINQPPKEPIEILLEYLANR